MSSVEDDSSQLKMEQFIKVLASYRLRLSDKQSSVLQKLYKVNHCVDPEVISIQPLLDLEKQIKSSDIYENVQMNRASGDMAQDLAGYAGDFHRHRVDKDAINKRIGLTEEELISMVVENDKLKEVKLALRHIDPERNGFVTQ